ncbi:MAG: phospholipase D-like domain-containing protein [Ignavibacteriae bacterium]|nr:phospholipase D-like domain-containing protein [Ignavibacteriota bacterium]
MKSGIKLLDNSSDEYRLSEILKELFVNTAYSQVSIATGYWDLPGMVEIYDSLKCFLERENTTFRLLLGEEPTVKSYQVRNPETVDPGFPGKYLKKDLEDLQLKNEFQKIADLLNSHINEKTENPKLQIRVYKKNFLHAKCYIFGSEDENAVGIIGSSNFTKQGLSGNLELNQFEDNNATVNYVRKNLNQHPSHRTWFEELWAESEEWSRIYKEEILDISKHGSICFSPYEMYIHALYKIYNQELEDEKENTVELDSLESGKPQLLKFQIRNANSLIKKLERQGVAMLSDSVGLGKTYTAIKVIEYYKQTLNQRVVIVVPASLIPQWRKSFDDFKMIHLPEIYSLQDTNRIEDIRENLKSIPVGLFVFDESHNLRSSGGQRFDVFIKWKQENENAKTLMLTATPVNNQLSDLTNQIMLGSGGNIYKLGKFYDRAKGKYFTLKERIELLQTDMKLQIRNSGFVNFSQLKEQLTPLLNRFIVRRTRQGIEKEYPEGLVINGELQKFPQSYPDNLEYEISNQYKSKLLEFAESDVNFKNIYQYSINSIADLEYLAHPLDSSNTYEKRDTTINSSLEIIYSGLLSFGFPCYRYNIYRHAYYGRKRGELKLNVDENRELSRQIGIYGIFRTIFLKRFESSLKSILLSVNSYEKKLMDFQEKLEKYNKIISVKNLVKLNKVVDAYNEQAADEDQLDFDINTFEESEEDFQTIEADPGIFFVERLKEDIIKDLSAITIIKNQLTLLISKDNKIKVLADKLDENEDNKVLIFTYFADTLKYLQAELPPLLRKKKNIEFALGSKGDIENYAQRFAPVAKKYNIKPDEKAIDFLAATDKLSEGQNLQDCGIIINYDLHWNPVRMIQRNGRINRLGTRHKEIFIYNFRPTEQLEQYLQLVRKLEDKINLIRYTIGSDQSVLDEEPIPQDYTEELYSRDEKKRLEAFKKIFETSELLAAEDLFMDDLREFDRSDKFNQEYKDLVKNLPKGKWGKVQMQKSDEYFEQLAHLIDDNDEAGYFVAFDDTYSGELLTSAEGLLFIKATSEENIRFKDKFINKPIIESKIVNFIIQYQFAVDDHLNRYNEPQNIAINRLIAQMQDYGYSVEDIELVYNCLFSSENAYINKQNNKLVRLLNRLLRNNQIIKDELIKEFLSLAHQYKPDEKTEKAPLKEIIQIFEF